MICKIRGFVPIGTRVTATYVQSANEAHKELISYEETRARMKTLFSSLPVR